MIQILGLLDFYFDAMVVEVKTCFYFYSDGLWPHSASGSSFLKNLLKNINFVSDDESYQNLEGHTESCYYFGFECPR